MEQLFSVKTVLAALFAGSAAFVLYRAWKGKRELALAGEEIGFSEKWVTGTASQGPQAGPQVAPNCLAVELSRRALVIRVMFPFNLQAAPEIFGGLENYIPREKIKSIRPAGGAGAVVVEFDSPAGVRSVELTLKRRDEFFRAAGAAFGRQPVPSGIFT